MLETPPLVPGRACGTCVVCCKIPSIEEESLVKPAGILCPHSTGSSCGIYESRPQTCRDFHCQWRHLSFLDENWRPDKSGVLIRVRALSGADGGELALNLIVFENHDVILDEGFARVVAMVVERGVEVILTILGADSAFGNEATLNPYVGSAVAAGSLPAVMAGIRKACAIMDDTHPA